MKILEKGHKYELDNIDGEIKNTLTFVKKFRGIENHPGTTIQDVIKCLIDRVQTLNGELPWEGNEEIIKQLRLTIGLLECRALMRKIEKEEIKPEKINTSLQDGHFKLMTDS